ncbi:MAG: hypothetical protein ACRD1B_06470 [Thermoanaerobaculia bacterium]
MSDVTDSQMAGTPAAAPARTRRRTAPRRKATAAPRKTVSRRKSSSARGKGGLERFVKAWAKRAAGAGVTLAALSSGGIEKTREALGKAGTASKKTIGRMAREWKQMDPRRRAQVVAALLAALAAASAPIVRSRIKKR